MVFPAISLPAANAIFDEVFLNVSVSISSLKNTLPASLLGTSIPMADLPGIGASILISAAARLNLISSAKDTILLTLTPSSGFNSYLVTDGPQLISVISTLTPKFCNVCFNVIAVSLFSRSRLEAFELVLRLSRLTGGNLYCLELSADESAVFSLTCISSVSDGLDTSDVLSVSDVLVISDTLAIPDILATPDISVISDTSSDILSSLSGMSYDSSKSTISSRCSLSFSSDALSVCSSHTGSLLIRGIGVINGSYISSLYISSSLSTASISVISISEPSFLLSSYIVRSLVTPLTTLFIRALARYSSLAFFSASCFSFFSIFLSLALARSSSLNLRYSSSDMSFCLPAECSLYAE